MFAVLLSTFMLVAADPPATASGAATSMAEPAKPAKAPEMVCHIEKPTGSHFVERVCVTPEDAAKAQQAAQDTITALNRRPKASDKPPK